MEIGYHKMNITPDHSVAMAGYSRKNKSTGVLDPIEINTLIIKTGEKCFIISMLDAIIIEDSVINPVKRTIKEKYGLADQNIIIGCIHTHSAPAYFKPFFEEVEVEQELQLNLINQFVASIDGAFASLQEASLKISQVEIEGLYGNRNEMNGYSDKTLTKLDFRNGQMPICTILALSCHPTILNGTNTKLSADIFGSIRQKYQAIYGNPCMVINGAAGDVSTRFYRQHEGVEEIARFTTVLFSQFSNMKDVHLRIDDIESAQVIKKYEFYGQDEFTSSEIKRIEALSDPKFEATLLRALKLKQEKSPMTLKLTSNIIDLGDLLFVSLPGDITSPLAKTIKDAFKDKLVLIIGYAENYSNYFVSEQDYGKYFETYISRLEKGNSDDFIKQVIKEAKKLK